MAREVEAKLHLRQLSERQAVIRLRSLGLRFGRPVTQDDYVYARTRQQLLQPRRGDVVARVRVENAKRASLTVKIRQGEDLDRIEFETGVSDALATRQALEAIGLVEVVRVRKRRRVARREQATVVLDHVDSLGLFLEIEVLDHPAPDFEIGREVEWLTAGLGEQSVERISSSYDTLLLRQGGA